MMEIFNTLYELINVNKDNATGTTDIQECDSQLSDFIWKSDIKSNIAEQYKRYLEYMENIKKGEPEDINELEDIVNKMMLAIEQVPDFTKMLKELRSKIALTVESKANKYWEDQKIK